MTVFLYSQILFIFALPFLGLIKKRPLWTSVSMIMTAIGLLICTIPFFSKDSSEYAGGWNVGNSGPTFCGQNVTETVSCVMRGSRHEGSVSCNFSAPDMPSEIWAE